MDGLSAPDSQQGSAGPDAAVLELRWGATLLDVIRVRRGHRAHLVLPQGTKLSAHHRDGRVELRAAGRRATLSAGEAFEHGGLRLELVACPPAPRARTPVEVDAVVLHAWMVAAAVQVCAVSALLLAPAPLPDPDAGAGVPQRTLLRYVRVSAGHAPERGQSLEVAGRAPDDAERATALHSARGAPIPRAAARRPTDTLASALSALDRLVHQGAPLGDLKDTLGDVARTTAAAPELGAGFGGLLAPVALVSPGPGSGELGLGTSTLASLLQARIRLPSAKLPPRKQFEKRVEERLAALARELAEAAPVVEASLDPLVRDHLTRAVRARQNAVRSCYEAFGLAQDASRTGRVVLVMTLGPDGHVVDPVVELDDPALALVGDCIEARAAEWYLGDGLVTAPVRLSFPFILQPRASHVVIDSP